MRRGRSAGRTRLLVVLLALPLGLVTCGKDATGISNPEERALLFQLNAKENEGKTVRWDPLPISVFLPSEVGEESEVTEWANVSSGKVRFAFVGGTPERGINFRLASLDDDVCGVTNVEFDDNRLQTADVRVNRKNFRKKGCVRTVVHEAGHAIGILDHTSDGGLMDPDGGDGKITHEVAEMVRNLYSLKPGTRVSLFENRGRAERRGGRYVVTIIDRVRR